MKEVKKEVFGSRSSILMDHFVKNNILFVKDIWFVTCRNAINDDIRSRYLVLIENTDPISTNLFKDYIPVYRVSFQNGIITITNLRNNVSNTFDNKGDFRNWIVSITKCKYIQSYASGSSASTSLSIFFRENMGKGFSLSDIDFLLTKRGVLIEEKTFIKNGKGYLGQGQCYTFREIVNDICNNLPLHIILSDEDYFYKVNFNTISCSNLKVLSNWGTMVEFDLSRKYSLTEIIDSYK